MPWNAPTFGLLPDASASSVLISHLLPSYCTSRLQFALQISPGTLRSSLGIKTPQIVAPAGRSDVLQVSMQCKSPMSFDIAVM